jgi:hypothetical protein
MSCTEKLDPLGQREVAEVKLDTEASSLVYCHPLAEAFKRRVQEEGKR